MEQNNNTYKYLSIVLAIIAIIFAVLYFTKPSEPVSDTLNGISDDAAECRADLADWQQRNSGQASTTENAREELSDILKNCQDIFQNSQEKL